MEAPGVLGLFGGTFDPIHLGHLAVARAALDGGAIDRLRWIPAGRPPHREGPRASAEDRLAMVRLALGDDPRQEIDEGEVRAAAQGAPSYTVTTLERLRRELGDARPLALIVGADAFLGLPTWHRWREITALAHLLVAARPGHAIDPETLPAELSTLWRRACCPDPSALAVSPAGGIATFVMTPTAISATAIRARLEAGASPTASDWAGLLPPAVLGYIRKRRLYRPPAP